MAKVPLLPLRLAEALVAASEAFDLSQLSAEHQAALQDVVSAGVTDDSACDSAGRVEVCIDDGLGNRAEGRCELRIGTGSKRAAIWRAIDKAGADAVQLFLWQPKDADRG